MLCFLAVNSNKEKNERKKQINYYFWTIITACIFLLYQTDAAALRQKREHEEISLNDFHSLDISHLFNSKAFGADGNIDGLGGHFAVDTPFSKKDMITHSLVPFSKSQTIASKRYDNIQVANSQTFQLSGKDPLGALYLLITSTHGPVTAKVEVLYTDQTKDHSMVILPDWQDPFLNEIDRFEVLLFPLGDHLDRSGGLFSVPIFVNPSKTPVSLIISKEKGDQQIHLFGVTEYAVRESNSLIIVGVQPTNQWISRTEQVMVVKIQNTGSKWITHASVHVMGHGRGSIQTITRGYVEEIAPGHIQTTQVTVQYDSDHLQKQQKNLSGNGSNNNSVDMTITLLYQQEGNKDELFTTRILDTSLNLQNSVGNFSQTTDSVKQHRAPGWLRDSKFGIFVHWGLYSVPAWAPVGKSYAEWYWWSMNHKDDPTFEYHRQKYGENFAYDDFLKQWEPTHFDPFTWLDVINQSRARYFVFTTKHHDGIALFNTSVTNRSTSKLLSTGKDFVGEFMSAAEKLYPHLKRGLYCEYSMCDIGGINNSTVWQSDYFNNALSKGKQVSVNDRCGDGSGSDFTTIEYKTVKEPPSRFWEATRGMDPYSFGFNRETKVDEYATSEDLIKTLVDTVSKGGNFLLNIGPDSTGIIPGPMAERLVTMGKWLDIVSSGIFDSLPYWIASEEEADVHMSDASNEKTSLRFTSSQNGKSVYIFSFMKPKMYQKITVKTPLPVQINDYDTTRISVMFQQDKKRHSELPKLEWFIDAEGSTVFSIDLTEEDLKDMPILAINITHV
ncbi:glycoside hydrolase family 29 protein [Backusella circina FSU 941]|nr:glycoside hydrolase family 29 protein [Backusella circina FSU 941]